MAAEYFLIEALEPGDVIFSTTNRLASRLIRWSTRSSFSHASVYISAGVILESNDNGAIHRRIKLLGLGQGTATLAGLPYDSWVGIRVFRHNSPIGYQYLWRTIIPHLSHYLGKDYPRITRVAINSTQGNKPGCVRRGLALLPITLVLDLWDIMRNRDPLTPGEYCSKFVNAFMEAAGNSPTHGIAQGASPQLLYDSCLNSNAYKDVTSMCIISTLDSTPPLESPLYLPLVQQQEQVCQKLDRIARDNRSRDQLSNIAHQSRAISRVLLLVVSVLVVVALTWIIRLMDRDAAPVIGDPRRDAAVSPGVDSLIVSAPIVQVGKGAKVSVGGRKVNAYPVGEFHPEAPAGVELKFAIRNNGSRSVLPLQLQVRVLAIEPLGTYETEPTMGATSVWQYFCQLGTEIGPYTAYPRFSEADKFPELDPGESVPFSILVNATQPGIYTVAVSAQFPMEKEILTASSSTAEAFAFFAP